MCRELVNELGERVMQFKKFEALLKERERAYICMRKRLHVYRGARPDLRPHKKELKGGHNQAERICYVTLYRKFIRLLQMSVENER